MGLSLGLVGLGSFGSSFAPLFKSHPLVDRIALCDREPERIREFADRPSFQDKFSPKDAYDTLDDICKADLDALVIITQPWLHAPQAIQAMESGKHVYSAVPLTYLPDGDEILEWCDKVIAACQRTGRHYMLGETTVYRPEAMYCRRRAGEGAFGAFVHAEGEYYHPFDSPGCDLRDVRKRRLASRAGQEWIAIARAYRDRGVLSSPMHYPTHSVSGPLNVMKAYAVKVCAWGFGPAAQDAYFEDTLFSDETALFHLSNGATMRISEYREVGHTGSETFRVFGTEGTFREDAWVDKAARTPLSVDDMRDPLPPEVEEAFRAGLDGARDVYGGHGGSHAFLVHEFVDAIARERTPAVSAWDAARYMAAGVTAHKSAARDGEVLEVPDWGDAPA
ncbi:MAG: Gfo/Idh/MocA family oxidoreductase [Candidatus Hydrogenedentes bacterium]|nr:Gfo/Idh/MocA family oxidoreductase [Candidatus Hydrogenedentota bacterium]